MRLLAVAVGVGTLLTPSWTFAQAAPAPRPLAPQTPAAPRPAAPPAPAAPRQAAPAPAPALPPANFQAGMKYAYIRLDVIAAASSEGRLAGEKVKALNDQKVRELNDRNKALQAAQQKLEQGGAVLNEAARGQLQAEVERQQRDLQRFTEDAQQDVQALQQQLQADFQRKLESRDRQGREGEAGAHGVQRDRQRSRLGRSRHGPDRRHRPRPRRDRRQTRSGSRRSGSRAAAGGRRSGPSSRTGRARREVAGRRPESGGWTCRTWGALRSYLLPERHWTSRPD